MESKVCYRCKIAKSPQDFIKHAKSSDGLGSYCKLCNSNIAKDKRRKLGLKTDRVMATRPPKEELAKLYETMTIAEIARHYGYYQATISKWLRKYGLKTEFHKCDRSPLNKSLVIDLYCNQKKSVNEISHIINSSRTKIIDFLKRENIARRSKKENWRWKEEWNGYEEINGSFWNRTVKNAKLRNFEVSIDARYAYELFIKQDRKCALTGVLLTMSSVVRQSKQQTASLDRIDSSNGYIEGNVQWVHKDINIMKMAHSQEYFIDLCKQVANYNA